MRAMRAEKFGGYEGLQFVDLPNMAVSDGIVRGEEYMNKLEAKTIEPNTVFHDEIDERYSVRRIAPSDAAAIDRPGESPQPGAELSSWVAEANGEIIGSISMVSTDKDTGRLEQFRVASEWEADRRLARRLARAAADFARERGLLKLVIDVPEDFRASHAETVCRLPRGRLKRRRV